MAEVEDKLLDHNYDGIEEFDNPLPQWWVMLFILCTLFGIGYVFYYHVAEIGDSQLQEYANEFKLDENAPKSETPKEEFTNGEMFAPMTDDSAILEKGAKVYQVNCASCHAKDGGGGIGPNLTDDNWIHGGSMTDVVWTIVNGVPEKGMISWRSILNKQNVLAVANYIKSLKGTTAAAPKDPQGDLWDGTEKLPEVAN